MTIIGRGGGGGGQYVGSFSRSRPVSASYGGNYGVGHQSHLSPGGWAAHSWARSVPGMASMHHSYFNPYLSGGGWGTRGRAPQPTPQQRPWVVRQRGAQSPGSFYHSPGVQTFRAQPRFTPHLANTSRLAAGGLGAPIPASASFAPAFAPSQGGGGAGMAARAMFSGLLDDLEAAGESAVYAAGGGVILPIAVYNQLMSHMPSSPGYDAWVQAQEAALPHPHVPRPFVPAPHAPAGPTPGESHVAFLRRMWLGAIRQGSPAATIAALQHQYQAALQAGLQGAGQGQPATSSTTFGPSPAARAAFAGVYKD